MPDSLSRKCGRERAAQNNSGSLRPEPAGQLLCSGGGWGGNCDPYEIGVGAVGLEEVLVLVSDSDLPLRRRESWDRA
jgi:hypothetical protein